MINCLVDDKYIYNYKTFGMKQYEVCFWPIRIQPSYLTNLFLRG